MEEKILVKSEQYNVKKGLLLFYIAVMAIGLIRVLIHFFDRMTYYIEAVEDCTCKSWSKCWLHETFSSPAAYALEYSEFCIRDTLVILAVFGVICLLIHAWLRSHEMIVTDKRVYGQTTFGKRVDLPIDSVSAIGSSWPKGIAVATSSGRIAFLMIKNCDEIHKCVSDLLIERQNKPVATSAPVVKQEIPMSNADELKKYKELFDMGAITQDEFDAKKKQLLGL